MHPPSVRHSSSSPAAGATLDDFTGRVFVEGPECFNVGRGRDEFVGALSVVADDAVELIPTTLALGAAGPTVTTVA